jgi:hypothetical protein
VKTPVSIARVLIVISAVFLFKPCLKSQNAYDSLNVKIPKHYFKTVIIIDAYSKPKQNIKFDSLKPLTGILRSYAVKQQYFSFYTPIATIQKDKDSAHKGNTHILLTANFLSLQPQFEGIKAHSLIKLGFGTRLIFNSGKKGVWFVDVAPFITKDAGFDASATFRLGSTFVYSHNYSKNFNWRVGLTKSFMWGNRNYLPFIGLRLGALDKVHLSVQFPRSISFVAPINSHFCVSVFTRPQGGVFNFYNNDSLTTNYKEKTIQFARYEINNGLRLDVNIGSWFGAYASVGLSTRNGIAFYAETANKKQPRKPYRNVLYGSKLDGTGYFNVGMVFKFGKTRSYYNDKNIYDAIDLNNAVGNSDMGLNEGTSQIPKKETKNLKDSNLESIKDLVDYNDF